jgi:hypothetical protein
MYGWWARMSRLHGGYASLPLGCSSSSETYAYATYRELQVPGFNLTGLETAPVLGVYNSDGVTAHPLFGSSDFSAFIAS